MTFSLIENIFRKSTTVIYQVYLIENLQIAYESIFLLLSRAAITK